MASAIVATTTPAGEKDRWRTPRETFSYANRRYGRFELDAAADASNHLCEEWLGPGSYHGEDALTCEWWIALSPFILSKPNPMRVWCNPPYSMTAQFVAKAAEEAEAGRAQTTLLLPSTTDVRWWHRHVWRDLGPRPGVLVEFLSPRVRFLRPDGTAAGSPNFGSVLVTFLAKQ